MNSQNLYSRKRKLEEREGRTVNEIDNDNNDYNCITFHAVDFDIDGTE